MSTVLQLLSDKNPQNDVQAIQFLAKSGSPYAIELLREIVKRSKDAKMREYSQKAANHIKKQLISEHNELKGKRKRITDNSIHVEILMALAFVSLDDFQSSNAKRAVARAFALDMDLLDNELYYDVAEQVFPNRVQSIEDELVDFVKQEVKNGRVLKSNYPFYMYLIDVPIVMVMGAILLAIPNIDWVRRFVEYQIDNNRFIDWDMVTIVALVLIVIMAGRLAHLVYEQWQQKQLRGWEKEARHLAITHLETEIQKFVTAR
jgi:hypothetical protein